MYGQLLATTAQTIGGVLGTLGRLSEACESFKVSQERHTRHYGKHSVPVARVSIDLGRALFQLGDLAGAAEQYHLAESIFERRGWTDADGATNLLFFMGLLARSQGRPQESLDRLERCLAMQRKHLPPDHPLISRTLSALGLMQSSLGKGQASRISASESAFVRRRSQTHCARVGCVRRTRVDGAPLDQCAGCLRTYYCSVACQTADWKAECKALAEEGRVAAAAVAASERK